MDATWAELVQFNIQQRKPASSAFHDICSCPQTHEHIINRMVDELLLFDVGIALLQQDSNG